jgi:hypothetical protein
VARIAGGEMIHSERFQPSAGPFLDRPPRMLDPDSGGSMGLFGSRSQFCEGPDE